MDKVGKLEEERQGWLSAGGDGQGMECMEAEAHRYATKSILAETMHNGK